MDIKIVERMCFTPAVKDCSKASLLFRSFTGNASIAGVGACGKRAKLPGVNDLTLFVTVALASVGLSSSCVCRRLLHGIDINDRRTIISRRDPSQHPACISAVRRTTYSRRYGARRRSVKWDDSILQD